MHAAALTLCASHCAAGCSTVPGPGRLPPMYFWHLAVAAFTAGDEGLSPLPAWKTNPPPGAGSGKLGTPWERMHWEYLSASAWSCAGVCGAPRPDVLVVAVVFPALLLEVVVVRFATAGVFEPPQ